MTSGSTHAKCIVLGGGGHARVVIDSLRLADVDVHGVLDADRARWGTTVLDVPVLGGDELLAGLASAGIEYFVVGLGAAGNNRPRQRLFELGRANNLKPLTVRHSTAICSSWTKIGEGCQLLPGSIVNAGAELGMNVIVNSGAIVEHDCRIGHHVHVATGAKLASTVHVGDRAHVGAGATILQCVEIGEDSVVGAGAVVVKNVPAGQTFVGVPARPIRT